jgi:hypothetical protein
MVMAYQSRRADIPKLSLVSQSVQGPLDPQSTAGHSGNVGGPELGLQFGVPACVGPGVGRIGREPVI